jgi:hypothetical protein
LIRKVFLGMKNYRLTLAGWASTALALLLLVTGCKTVPVTGRTELNFVSPGQEAQLGLASFDEL